MPRHRLYKTYFEIQPYIINHSYQCNLNACRKHSIVSMNSSTPTVAKAQKGNENIREAAEPVFTPSAKIRL